MDPKWICGLVGMAALLGLGVLFHHAEATVGASVISLAQSIVTGAFGIAVGHAIGKPPYNPKDLPAGALQQTLESVQMPPLDPAA